MPLNLFPYQETGADFLARRERAGLHDEMGVGKTAQVIRACDLRRAKRVLVVCPAHLRSNWVKEFAMFAHVPRRVARCRNLHDLIAWQRGRFDVLTMSYEQATSWRQKFFDDADIFEVLACDEAHYMKNDGAQRTKAVLGENSDGSNGIMQFAAQYWHITGTPMSNDPLDIYTFLKSVKATTMGKTSFIRRYFNSRVKTYGSSQSAKAEMLPELQQLIRANSLRRMQEDVGIQLPPIFLTETLLDGDNRAVLELLSEHPGLESAIIQAVNEGGLSFLDAQHIATLRRLVGEAKAVPYAQLLISELNNGLDKAVVMGVHRTALQHVQNALARANIRSVLVQGGMSDMQREACVTAFQADPACRVFIGNIKAAGTGLTLTASAALDMLESEWAPASNAQALKRVHRLTQTRSVRARFITLAGSLDETVNRIVAQKTADIAAIEGVAMNAIPSAA